MINIFLETNKSETSEYVFIRTLLEDMFGESWKDNFTICPAGGKDKLKFLAPTLDVNSKEGSFNLIIFDADSEINGGGFNKRREEILSKRDELNVEFDLFLFPNNNDDGDFETLLDMIVQRDKHKVFFDCYSDYECCVQSQRDSDKKPIYNIPNLKGKLHTFISAVTQSKKKQKRLGVGEWQFSNREYWDLDSPELEPLKSFIKTTLVHQQV